MKVPEKINLAGTFPVTPGEVLSTHKREVTMNAVVTIDVTLDLDGPFAGLNALEGSPTKKTECTHTQGGMTDDE